jgi:hypothetical protein
MTTASDGNPPSEVERPLALLDHPQPLGFVPTRRFWNDRENARLAGIPRAAFAFVLGIVIATLDLPWWAAGLTVAGGLWLWQGLFERYIRQAAIRRFRSRPKPPALEEPGKPKPCLGAMSEDC